MDFIKTREREMQKFPSDLPIFLFLRKCRKKNIKMFEKILFFLGEIDLEDKKEKQTISWCAEKSDLLILREAFEVISPNGKLHVKDLGYGMIEIRLTWKHDEDIDPVVFNKIIFPDFCILPKRDLFF